MTFSADLKAFAAKVEGRQREIFVRSTQEITRSMAEGSELTGAPGQPVDTAALRTDWATNGAFTEQWVWETGTNKDYAEAIEYDLPVNGGAKFSEIQKSPVGGTHSRAATIAGWQNIVNHVAGEVVG